MKHRLSGKLTPRWCLPMKAPVIVLLIVLLSFNQAIGQDDDAPGTLSYGAKLGFTMSEFVSSQPHTGGKIGLTVGGFAIYPLSDLLAIQAELGYLQQGGTYVQFIDDTRFGAPFEFIFRNVKDASVTIHSIYLPVQAKLSLPSESGILPDLLVGPYVAYNFAATEQYKRTGEIEDRLYATATGEDVVSDRYEDLQFGVVGGIQYEIPSTSSLMLIINASYKYGISPVKENHSYIDFTGVVNDLTTQAFIFSIGVKL
ncbi:MAG: porin family protein [Bacteroidota bacterium]